VNLPPVADSPFLYLPLEAQGLVTCLHITHKENLNLHIIIPNMTYMKRNPTSKDSKDFLLSEK